MVREIIDIEPTKVQVPINLAITPKEPNPMASEGEFVAFFVVSKEEGELIMDIYPCIHVIGGNLKNHVMDFHLPVSTFFDHCKFFVVVGHETNNVNVDQGGEKDDIRSKDGDDNELFSNAPSYGNEAREEGFVYMPKVDD